MEHSERVWLARLRWRMRGAWLWPAFFALTAVDGALIVLLPPWEGAPEDAIGAVLMAGFANIAAIAALGPLAARALRSRRRDLPRVVAFDYAGTALLVVLTGALVAAGLAHRPAETAARGDEAAMFEAVHEFVLQEEPGWLGGLDRVDAVLLAPDVYRACVPGHDPRRSLCVIVDTDTRPARVSRDGSMEPN